MISASVSQIPYETTTLHSNANLLIAVFSIFFILSVFVLAKGASISDEKKSNFWSMIGGIAFFSVVIGSLFTLFHHYNWVDSEVVKIEVSSNEKLKNSIADKYGATLRENAIESIYMKGDLKLFVTKGLVNGTSADGANIQLSFEVKENGDVIAYSSGAELALIENE